MENIISAVPERELVNNSAMFWSCGMEWEVLLLESWKLFGVLWKVGNLYLTFNFYFLYFLFPVFCGLAAGWSITAADHNYFQFWVMTSDWVRVTPRQHKPPALIRGHLISQLFQILSKAEGWFICLCQCRGDDCDNYWAQEAGTSHSSPLPGGAGRGGDTMLTK